MGANPEGRYEIEVVTNFKSACLRREMKQEGERMTEKIVDKQHCNQGQNIEHRKAIAYSSPTCDDTPVNPRPSAHLYLRLSLSGPPVSAAEFEQAEAERGLALFAVARRLHI